MIGGGNVAYDVARTVLRQIAYDTARTAARLARHGPGARWSRWKRSKKCRPTRWKSSKATRKASNGTTAGGRWTSSATATAVTAWRSAAACGCTTRTGGSLRVFDDAQRLTLPCDTVLLAVGQSTNLEFLDDGGADVEQFRPGWPKVDPAYPGHHRAGRVRGRRPGPRHAAADRRGGLGQGGGPIGLPAPHRPGDCAGGVDRAPGAGPLSAASGATSRSAAWPFR